MATKMLRVLHQMKEKQTKDKLFGALPQLKSVQLNSPASLPGSFQQRSHGHFLSTKVSNKLIRTKSTVKDMKN